MRLAHQHAGRYPILEEPAKAVLNGTECSEQRNLEIPADLTSEEAVDFAVTGNREDLRAWRFT